MEEWRMDGWRMDGCRMDGLMYGWMGGWKDDTLALSHAIHCSNIPLLVESCLNCSSCSL